MTSHAPFLDAERGRSTPPRIEITKRTQNASRDHGSESIGFAKFRPKNAGKQHFHGLAPEKSGLRERRRARLRKKLDFTNQSQFIEMNQSSAFAQSQFKANSKPIFGSEANAYTVTPAPSLASPSSPSARAP